MNEIERGTTRHRAARRRTAERLAEPQDGVLGRRQLYAAGITRHEIEAEARAGRWRLLGRQSILVVPEAGPRAGLWRAHIEVGSLAVLDGPSALIAAGLRTVTCNAVHVVVPKSAHRIRCAGVVVHESRRFREADVLRNGLPRMKPAVAAVHTALWVRSEREAASFVLASAQQRIIRAGDFEAAAALVRKDPRRRFLLDLVQEVRGGIQSIGEQEFARLCLERGLPPPTRQVLRRGAKGRVYLDVYWDDFKVCVEIDGIHHLDVRSVIDDSLKQNAVALEETTTIRIPLRGLRQEPDLFMEQVEKALIKGGWDGQRSVRASAS